MSPGDCSYGTLTPRIPTVASNLPCRSRVTYRNINNYSKLAPWINGDLQDS